MRSIGVSESNRETERLREKQTEMHPGPIGDSSVMSHEHLHYTWKGEWDVTVLDVGWWMVGVVGLDRATVWWADRRVAEM